MKNLSNIILLKINQAGGLLRLYDVPQLNAVGFLFLIGGMIIVRDAS